MLLFLTGVDGLSLLTIADSYSLCFLDKDYIACDWEYDRELECSSALSLKGSMKLQKGYGGITKF